MLVSVRMHTEFKSRGMNIQTKYETNENEYLTTTCFNEDVDAMQRQDSKLYGTSIQLLQLMLGKSCRISRDDEKSCRFFA